MDLTGVYMVLSAALGGGLVKILEVFLARSNRTMDEGTAIRKELREDVKALQDRVQKLNDELVAMIKQSAVMEATIDAQEKQIGVLNKQLDLVSNQLVAVSENLTRVTIERDDLTKRLAALEKHNGVTTQEDTL